jgi:hypothetical protein
LFHALKRPRSAALLLASFACVALGALVLGGHVLGGHVSTLRAEGPAERYVLPITPPADQADTGLCWVFATLSMLETNYMQRHAGHTIELSRAALQRDAIGDRFRRLIRGEPSRLGDGGLAVEALALIHEDGLFERSDLHDIVDSDPVISEIAEKIADYSARDEKQEALSAELEEKFGPNPRETHLGAELVTPARLARAVLGGKTWTEFDLAADGVEGWGPSHDPDARPDTRVRYVSRERLIGLIHKSLKRGEAVVAGTEDHARLIYGADYDAGGRAIAYLIKDSLAPHLYREDAETMHRSLNDVTVSVETAGSA